MSRFEVEQTGLKGLQVVTRRPLSDDRGWFERLFCVDELSSVIGQRFLPAQINRSSTSTAGTIRGMHFQRPPEAEIKFVSCLKGEVFDVAVDLRAESPTFLGWYGARLSASNRKSLLIPKGFAHGFQSILADSELLYLHSTGYAPASEDGIHPLDPRVGIDWPLTVAHMSARDATRPFLASGFIGIPDAP